jgi:hypothetical protein
MLRAKIDLRQPTSLRTEGLKGGFKEWVCASHRVGLRNGWMGGMWRKRDQGFPQAAKKETSSPPGNLCLLPGLISALKRGLSASCNCYQVIPAHPGAED